MDYDKLIERLKNAAGGLEGIKMCQDAALAIETLRADLARVTAERDGAIEAVKNMAEYIVCAGRVDYYLCDDNEPCYKCIADWFLQGHEWQGNCW